MIKSISKIAYPALSLLFLAACQSTAQTALNNPQKITGLKTPESVVQAKDGRIFVSEIGEFGKNGDGQISVIGLDGKISVFASGLDDPKGLAIIGENLYVTDNTKVLKIGSDGKSSLFVAADKFPQTPIFLNDIEADTQGNLYVSDSGDIMGKGGGAAIYKISPDATVKLLINDQQDARIKAPNGLLADDTGNFLLEVDFTSGILYSLNTQTGQLSDIAEGFGGGDGIVHHSNGNMYVSDWKNGKVFSVNTKGDVTLLKDGYKASADIAITKDEKYLLVPDMKAGELDFISLQ
ncbi:MAG: gluconolaconase [Methylotenera sp. 24-45-7]|jgi:sugar lactone lactonase YvrE|nr:MAG: gluconolaconase [Methylotenera sp. 24-45-7]OZA09018.1 MAG: gluconolaconase [Methylotenera sp. 17-45-7]OZA51149.1 MAG: gluconolaconase [Methylophilales bacterium 39-45-7]HQS37635.1 SMP-30/gluconolactonase/LRE family protein [Methylotenera sp.]HQS43490.1 SMP-30/gluconolactonase/LRE family protein [Methylotenera sp.]